MHWLNQPLERTDLLGPHYTWLQLCGNFAESRAALLNMNCCPSGNELNIQTESLQGDSIIQENLLAEWESPNYEPMALKMPKASIIRGFTCNTSWVWTISSRLTLSKLQIPQCWANWSYKNAWQALHTTLGYFTYRHLFYALYYAAVSDCSLSTVNTTIHSITFYSKAFFSPTASAFQCMERI